MQVKQPKTFDEQISILENRGCVISDRNNTKLILQRINYYRLTAFFLPYIKIDGTYKSGTTFDRVYRNYLFDAKLRSLLFPLIEEIELLLRTRIAYYHSHKYGSLGYMDKNCFSKKHNHDIFLKRINEYISKNTKQPFVCHHINKYNGEFPLWVAIELFTTHTLSLFYSDMLPEDQKDFAKTVFGAKPKDIISWLHCLTILRNHCAHFSRIYYYSFPFIPKTPKKFSYVLSNEVFDYIVVLRFLYPHPEHWQQNFVEPLKQLIFEYSDSIELSHIGFPNNWEAILSEPVLRVKGYKP